MFALENFSMPGIRRIAYLDPADLPHHIRYSELAGMIPKISAPTVDINFFGEAELTYTKSKEGKMLTSLTFLSSDIIPAYDVVFIVEDNMRQRRLVGSWELPYPSVKIERTTAKGPGHRRQSEYSVSWPGYPTEVVVWLDDDDKRPIRDE